MPATAHPFAQLIAETENYARPELRLWRPTAVLDLGFRIDAGGQWLHQGAPITHMRLRKLFASLLRREGARHFLITPHMKYPVAVDDAPFCAVECERRGTGARQNIFFRTNMDEVVRADAAHPICMKSRPGNGDTVPYVEVRDGLSAKISRAVYYELTQWLRPAPGDDSAQIGVYSGGKFFALGER